MPSSREIRRQRHQAAIKPQRGKAVRGAQATEFVKGAGFRKSEFVGGKKYYTPMSTDPNSSGAGGGSGTTINVSGGALASVDNVGVFRIQTALPVTGGHVTPITESGVISIQDYDPIGAAASGLSSKGVISSDTIYDGGSPGTFATHFLRKDGVWADVSASLNAFVTWSWTGNINNNTPFTTVADSSADTITVTAGTGIQFTDGSSGATDAITIASTIPNLTASGAGTVHANNYTDTTTNHHLTSITKSGNVLTFVGSYSSNPTYTFGSNAFNSTAYLTGNEAIALSGDISGTGSTAITTVIGVNKVNDTHIDWGTGTNQVSTDDIPEGGTNLFTSSESIDDRVNSLVTDGTGISTVYDDGANTLTFNVTLNGLDTSDLSESGNLYHTTARARSSISATNSISYNSGTGVISFTDAVTGGANTLSDSSLPTTDGYVGIFKELSTQQLKFYALKAGDNIVLDKNNDGGEANTYITISASDAPTTNRFTGIIDDGVTTYTASGATDTLKISGSTAINASASQTGSTVTVAISADLGTGASQAAAGNHTHAAGDVGLGTGADVRFDSFGVGTGASGTTGEIRATNEVTAYYSDDRLKNKYGNIEDALKKVCSLNGFHYQANELAGTFGYDTSKKQVGVSAQECLKVMPEVVASAPIDAEYYTVHYEKLVPLLIEAIKELSERKCICGSK